MTAPIAIAVSGGIDSLVAAYLLKQTGANVFGIHFLTGFEGPPAPESTSIASCCRQVAMPVVVVDLRRAIHQFDDGHRRIISRAKTAFEDTQVTTRTCFITRAKFIKQLGHHITIT